MMTKAAVDAMARGVDGCSAAAHVRPALSMRMSYSRCAGAYDPSSFLSALHPIPGTVFAPVCACYCSLPCSTNFACWKFGSPQCCSTALQTDVRTCTHEQNALYIGDSIKLDRLQQGAVADLFGRVLSTEPREVKPLSYKEQ